MHADLAGQYEVEPIVRLLRLDQHRPGRNLAHLAVAQERLQIRHVDAAEQSEAGQLVG